MFLRPIEKVTPFVLTILCAPYLSQCQQFVVKQFNFCYLNFQSAIIFGWLRIKKHVEVPQKKMEQRW